MRECVQEQPLFRPADTDSQTPNIYTPIYTYAYDVCLPIFCVKEREGERVNGGSTCAQAGVLSPFRANVLSLACALFARLLALTHALARFRARSRSLAEYF